MACDLMMDLTKKSEMKKKKSMHDSMKNLLFFSNLTDFNDTVQFSQSRHEVVVSVNEEGGEVTLVITCKEIDPLSPWQQLIMIREHQESQSIKIGNPDDDNDQDGKRNCKSYE